VCRLIGTEKERRGNVSVSISLVSKGVGKAITTAPVALEGPDSTGSYRFDGGRCRSRAAAQGDDRTPIYPPC
jgi:hypothetical protein